MIDEWNRAYRSAGPEVLWDIFDTQHGAHPLPRVNIVNTAAIVCIELQRQRVA